MKHFCLLLACLPGLCWFARGQEDASPVAPGSVVFDQLLSVDNTVLMTNAEFREVFGRKVVFKNGLDLESFDVDNLNSNVLAKLHIDTAAAKAAAIKKAEADAAWASQNQALAAKQAASSAAANSNAMQQAQAANPAPNGKPGGKSKHNKNAAPPATPPATQ